LEKCVLHLENPIKAKAFIDADLDIIREVLKTKKYNTIRYSCKSKKDSDLGAGTFRTNIGDDVRKYISDSLKSMGIVDERELDTGKGVYKIEKSRAIDSMVKDSKATSTSTSKSKSTRSKPEFQVSGIDVDYGFKPTNLKLDLSDESKKKKLKFQSGPCYTKCKKRKIITFKDNKKRNTCVTQKAMVKKNIPRKYGICKTLECESKNTKKSKYSKSHNLFDQYFTPKGRTKFYGLGDGNCLFHAINLACEHGIGPQLVKYKTGKPSYFL
jgi:hypothetical protein